jgi:phage protein D
VANQYTTGFVVKIDGTELKPEAVEKIKEWRVDDHLKLADTFSIKIFEPSPDRMTLIDDEALFAVGNTVEIAVSGVPVEGEQGGGAAAMETLIKGIITSIEPEFSAEAGAIMTVRGYDRSHTMNQEKKATTFQNMTVGDIVKKVVSSSGLAADVSAHAGGALDFVQQNNESDWEFLGRMAQRVGARVVVNDKKLEFKPAGDSAPGPTLEWGKTLLSFRPRVTGVQQASEVLVRGWDPKAKKAIEATARPSAQMLTSLPGLAAEGVRSKIVDAMKGGRHTIADRPVGNASEAQALADSAMAKIANSYVEAEGVCLGDPKVKAGGKVEIKGVGKRFSGKYLLSATRHVYRANGYRTHFTISGEAERSLVDLLTPARTKRWGNSVVLGVVTNNQDPQNLGRVRVKFPALGDTEGNWARVCTPGAGKKKGVMMIPQVGDEVVIGFEHDDVNQPFILGSVWNGQDTAADAVPPMAQKAGGGGAPKDVIEEGSFALQSQKRVLVDAKEELSLASDKELVLTIGESKVTCKKDGTIEITGKTVKMSGTQGVTIESPQGSVTVKSGPGGTTVSSQGTVSVSGTQVSLG